MVYRSLFYEVKRVFFHLNASLRKRLCVFSSSKPRMKENKSPWQRMGSELEESDQGSTGKVVASMISPDFAAIFGIVINLVSISGNIHYTFSLSHEIRIEIRKTFCKYNTKMTNVFLTSKSGELKANKLFSAARRIRLLLLHVTCQSSIVWESWSLSGIDQSRTHRTFRFLNLITGKTSQKIHFPFFLESQILASCTYVLNYKSPAARPI